MLGRLERSGGSENLGSSGREYLEVHFGKPVVARVRKCRLVVVKDRRAQNDEDERPKDDC